ncbi:hypothetical protein SLEP1_g53535 [Rubroshorea leprosula]|uniref:Uncharacterized protein n=1 Tax=Rubroshorea leprosula TaxID=152421 RepID=A0AAV5MAU3_9ROSI|nr:hypothetical protein SLEP1_g53535 [Rubroshorea leprosula]
MLYRISIRWAATASLIVENKVELNILFFDVTVMKINIFC